MEPVRTCVGCRQRANRADLARLCIEQPVTGQVPVLVHDTKAILPGRGAWIHASNECLKLAIERKAFGRALKLSATPDSTGLHF
ncbi:MAG: YlxR family protein [Actinomycetales bacterium]|nr:YlxR family protein [Actinomycetales bacterium]